MCVVRGGNVTPGPLTRGPGRVSGYPSEGRMSPPPYAGHQLAACTHAPCAPCAPRSQVHVLGAPVSYMQTHICKVCNHMHIFYGQVSCSKVCTMFPGLIYARCTCLVYKSMHILYAHCTRLFAKVCIHVPCSQTLKPVIPQWGKEQKFQRRKAHQI